jgi:uracil-DNA glycosylase
MQPPSEFTSASEYYPARISLPSLRAAAAGCRACDLWLTGTQTVFGEGRRTANVIFVGEQPGDKEDIAGKPFVGPAGRLLDEALENAGIDRSTVYVTNAVKHFKWDRPIQLVGRAANPPRNTEEKRLHKSPNTAEGRACRPWLEAEFEVLHPQIVVCLGAFAAKIILGPSFRVTKERGKPITPTKGLFEEYDGDVPTIFATVHPSSVLRSPTPEDRAKARRAFFGDIEKIGKYMKTSIR